MIIAMYTNSDVIHARGLPHRPNCEELTEGEMHDHLGRLQYLLETDNHVIETADNALTFEYLLDIIADEGWNCFGDINFLCTSQ